MQVVESLKRIGERECKLIDKLDKKTKIITTQSRLITKSIEKIRKGK